MAVLSRRRLVSMAPRCMCNSVVVVVVIVLLLCAIHAKAVNLAADFRLHAEYFNSPLRCWEPLLEPLSGRITAESCADRGNGLVVRLDCPLHLNVTGALLDTMDDFVRIVEQATNSSSSNPAPGSAISGMGHSTLAARHGPAQGDVDNEEGCEELHVGLCQLASFIIISK